MKWGIIKNWLEGKMYPLWKIENILLSSIDKRIKHPIVKSTEETLAYLLHNKCSMSRLGDGEFMLIFGHSIRYQKSNKELSRKLIEILHSNIPNHIVCVSDVFGDMKERNEENKKYWTNHLMIHRHQYYSVMDMKKVYFNTSASRVYKLLEDKSLAAPRFEMWKELWNERDVVFVEGEKTRMGVGNALFDNAKSIRRILGPAENAYSVWERIFEETKKIEKSALIILALGPTATVLSYELAKEGYQALDLGHIDIEYEWFLRERDNCVITGKYTNEVIGGNNVADIEDMCYKNQIIAVIKDGIR